MESEKDKNFENELPLRCDIESKTENSGIQFDYGNVSPVDEDIGISDNPDIKLGENLIENLTEEEMEIKRREAVELKKRGNEEYKLKKYLDSIDTYTEALVICPKNFTTERSIIYANRAASNMNIDNKESAIQDCSNALELDSSYLKAYLRRATLYEELDKLDESLEDFKKVLEIDPNCYQAQTGSIRIESKLFEKNEKLKEEMLGKLKDLGNLVLRPFGLSTDNFKLEKNSETGGYSINFNQKGGGT